MEFSVPLLIIMKRNGISSYIICGESVSQLVPVLLATSEPPPPVDEIVLDFSRVYEISWIFYDFKIQFMGASIEGEVRMSGYTFEW